MNWDAANQKSDPSPVVPEIPWRQDPTVNFFGWLLAFHVIGWTVLAVLTQPNVPAETLELLTEGSGPSWGYVKHPPLSVWLAQMATLITAPAVWPVYVLGQLCTAVSMACAWILARRFLHPWTALCASMVLEACFLFTISATTLNDSQIAGAFWAMAVLGFHTALTIPRRRYWMATGLCLGFGILASYATVLLLLAMFVFTLLDERARRCWDSSWPFLAAVMMAAVVLPHAVWLWSHDFVTIGYAFPISATGSDHVFHPVKFVVLQSLSVIPVLIVLGPLVSWFNLDETLQSSENDREFVRRYLLWVTCLPPAVLVAASVVSGTTSGVFDKVSFWAFAGVAWLLWGHIAETRDNWRRVLVRTGTVAGGLAAALIVINVMLPTVRQKTSSVHFPGKDLAAKVQLAWTQAGFKNAPPVIAGPPLLSRNASWYNKSLIRPIAYTEAPNEQQQLAQEEALRRSGGILLWDRTADGTAELDLLSRYSTARFLEPLELKWTTVARVEPVRIGMAIIPPEGTEIVAPPTTLPPAQPSVGNPATDVLPVSFESPTAPATPPATPQNAANIFLPPLEQTPTPSPSQFPGQPTQTKQPQPPADPYFNPFAVPAVPPTSKPGAKPAVADPGDEVLPRFN